MNDKFIVLTHSFIRAKDITMQEKIFYIEILNLSSTEIGCIASNEHFEKSFGVSKKSASNTISSLVKKGYIEVTLSDRNHKRLLSIKNGHPSIKSGESKDNITTNRKNIQKEQSEYQRFITYLKSKTSIPSKVTSTRQGESLFKQIKDKKKLIVDYIQHQKDKQEFSQRITAFMEDYKPQAQDEFGGLPKW